MNSDFVRDAAFDIESYLVKRLARDFAKAEDNAFINGTGAVFEVVQRIRNGRRRLTPMGEMPIIPGMMFCGDCGNKLYQVRWRV